MEHLPADARAAPSASAPNDTVMDNLESPKRPREASQGNMVSQRATSSGPVLPESQTETTDLLPRAPARACQSLAHHTTPMGRCRKTVDTWAPLSEEPQSRSTTTLPAERLGNHSNSVILAAVHRCGHTQTTPGCESTRVPDIPCQKKQTPPSSTSSNSPSTENTPPLTALDALSEHQRQTAHLPPPSTYATKESHRQLMKNVDHR
eukprot:scaffold17119_cov123-Isochrysis_galbana.AAC.3